MAIGKNKKLSKKQSRKKVVDPFSKKDWYDIKAPNNFEIRDIGKTPVTKYSTPKEINDGLVGRCIWVSLGDLKEEKKHDSFRKFRFRIQGVVSGKCLTRFHGMTLTTDKSKSLVRKWQTLIEANTDVKTADGFVLRLFCIGFTKRAKNQVKKTSYAKRSQIKAIRKIMIKTISEQVAPERLSGVVKKLIPDSIATEVNNACDTIYPLQNVFIRKVKVISAPKMDQANLLQMHEAESASEEMEDEGEEVDRFEEEEFEEES